MKNIFYLAIVLSLVGCNTLHHSIKKSNRHRFSDEVVEKADNPKTQFKEEGLELKEEFIEEPIREERGIPESMDSEVINSLKTEEVSTGVLPNDPPEEEEVTEEELAQKAKFDKNFMYTLITSIIGGPIAVTVGVVTFNSLLMLAIGAPFLLTAFALALFQIYKISHTIPDVLVDKKYHRRYIFADVVMIIVSILIGLGILAGVNAALSAL